MDKHYLEEILEIFKDEKDIKCTIENNYMPQITKLFDLENCNIHALRAIRDSVVFRVMNLAEKDLDHRLYYSEIVSYITSVIDHYIWNKGGQV